MDLPHNQWRTDEACDRRDVADEIEIELVVKRRVTAPAMHHEEVAIRRSRLPRRNI